MIMVHKHDLDSKLNLEGLKRGDKIEIEIADVTPMGMTLDPRTIQLKEVRNVEEPREPLMKTPKHKSLANMPLNDMKSMLQKPMPAPVMPPVAPAPLPPVK